MLHMSKEIQFALALFFSRSLFLSRVSAFRCEKERTKDMEDEVKKVNVPPVQSLPLGHKSPLFSQPFIYRSLFSTDWNDTLSFFFPLISPQSKIHLFELPDRVSCACVFTVAVDRGPQVSQGPTGPPRATAWCQQPCPERLCQWLSIIPSPSMCRGSHSSLWVTALTVAAHSTNTDTQVSPLTITMVILKTQYTLCNGKERSDTQLRSICWSPKPL